MNKKEFLQALIPVTEYYSKQLTDGLIEVYYSQVEEWALSTFEALLEKHIKDPDNGKYWPTVAHLSSQAGTSQSEGVIAGIEFDNNPCIDGFNSFDAQSETTYDRNERRKRYVNEQKLAFQNTSVIERLNSHCKGKLLTASKPKELNQPGRAFGE